MPAASTTTMAAPGAGSLTFCRPIDPSIVMASPHASEGPLQSVAHWSHSGTVCLRPTTALVRTHAALLLQCSTR